MRTRGYNSLQSWGVAAACAFINLMTMVPMRLAGLFFVAMIHRYDTNREMASWPFTIGLIMRCGPGPLIAYLGEYIGLRNLTILGTVMSAIGIGLCYFAEDIMAVIVLFGAIHGLGVSLANTLMPQVLKQHFDANLANANGIVYAASCLGAVLFSPLLQVLLTTYGASGSFLIIFGIMLNGIPIAFLCRAPDTCKKAPLRTADGDVNVKSLYDIVPVLDSEQVEMSVHKSSLRAADKNQKGEYSAIPVINSENGGMPVNYSSDKEDCHQDVVEESVVKPEDELAYEESKLVESAVKINLAKNSKNIELGQSKEVYASTTETIMENNKCRASLKTLSLFKDPLFLVMLVAHGVLIFANNCIYTVLVDLSRDKDIPESYGMYFVMALPAAELTGYLCLGWVTDAHYLSNGNYIALCFMFFSVGCWDLVWSTGFYTMLIGTLLIGVCTSGMATAFPGLVYEFIDEDKQAMAIASRLMLFTPLSFTTAPLIGYFRSSLGSYSGLLYLHGGLNAACAFLIVIMPWIARIKTKKVTRHSMRVNMVLE